MCENSLSYWLTVGQWWWGNKKRYCRVNVLGYSTPTRVTFAQVCKFPDLLKEFVVHPTAIGAPTEILTSSQRMPLPSNGARTVSQAVNLQVTYDFTEVNYQKDTPLYK